MYHVSDCRGGNSYEATDRESRKRKWNVDSNAPTPRHATSSALVISQGFCCFELEAYSKHTH